MTGPPANRSDCTAANVVVGSGFSDDVLEPICKRVYRLSAALPKADLSIGRPKKYGGLALRAEP